MLQLAGGTVLTAVFLFDCAFQLAVSLIIMVSFAAAKL
jgi:hypothetical protein